METVLRFIKTYVKIAERSVAFLPVPMIFGALALGFGLFYLELHSDISGQLGEQFPSLAITSQDTARTILGLFIGGLITLTVFTFSQIMILLNQVASNYSPRLLPKLTGDRSLQFVMGLNLATIVLTISVLISIRSNDSYKIPNLSVLICTILGIVCLCLFVYFVTAITRKIQVGQIIHQTSLDALRTLKRQNEKEWFSEKSLPDDLDDWYAIPAPFGGYVGNVNFARLSELAGQFGTRLYLGVNMGEYVPQNLPLLQSANKLTEEQIQKVMAAVSPIREQFDDWYLPNLKQLTEIALKAMSPGINDPGTALTVIDRQTEILAKLMSAPFNNFYRQEEEGGGGEGGEVWFSHHTYAQVLSSLMQEMRRYCKEDPLVVRRLFQMLYHLLTVAGDSISYQQYLRREISALLEDARLSIPNSNDRHIIARELLAHRRENLRDRRMTMLRETRLKAPGTKI